MRKTKIEWADMTWNPVTGCFHGCEYCYARRIAERFGLCKGIAHRMDVAFAEAFDGTMPAGEVHLLDAPVHLGRRDPYPYGFEPTLHRYLLDQPAKRRKPAVIFVCSMTDLFGAWVPDGWIYEVFAACLAAPQHNYLFLTKNPQRYNELLGARLLPKGDNFWWGGTRTGKDGDREREASMDGHTFLSIEPMLGPLDDAALGALELWDWVILGAETGNRKDKVVPKRAWVDEIVNYCVMAGVPVFMKDSLAPVVGADNLLRERPAGLE